MNPSSRRNEVIVNIDNPVDAGANMNTNNSGDNASPSEDFSFPTRPENEIEDNRRASIGSGMSNLGATDPTSSLIGQFLERQKAQGKMSLDMDMEMEELRQPPPPPQPQQHSDSSRISRHIVTPGSHRPPLPPDYCWSRNQSEIQSPECASSYQYKNTPTNNNSNNDGSKELRVSFHESLASELVRRPSSMYSNVHDSSSCSSSMSGDDETNRDHHHHHHKNSDHLTEILIRSRSNRTNTNASFRRMGSTLSKTKSRLIDPPFTPYDQRSSQINRSGQQNMKSGLLGKGSSVNDDEEEDPFLEDDFLNEFKRPKTSIWVILEWVSLVVIMGALICNLIIPILRRKTLWNLKLWKWEVLILALICGRLVSDWGIRLLVFCIEMNFLLRKRVLYFVYGLKKAVQNVIWLGLVLLTWNFLFDKKLFKKDRNHPLNTVTRILVIGEVGAILWLLKTLLVKVLASNFHVKAFFDRIQDSLFNQFVIETLSAPPMLEYHQAQEEDERTMAEVHSLQKSGMNAPFELRSSTFARNKSGRSSIVQTTPHNGKSTTPYKSPIGQSTRFSDAASKKHDEGITIENLSKLNQKNVSAWNMKRLMRIIRNGGLTTLDEHLVDPAHHHQDDEAQTHIRSEVEAKAAARKIFRNVAKPRSRYIYMEDLMRFMREDEALKTMSLFEGAIENERISKKSLKNWVVSAFRERRALALTLSDTKSAVNKLHKMVNVIVSVIILIIAFTSLDIIKSQSLLFLSSQIVLVAFVFGNTCKNVFESIIFLFVIHPYDIGDRCEIDAVQMIVEEINILTTVFLRYDNLKVVIPNYVLLTKPIYNFYRSPDMGDAIELCFHIATPTEKIALIRQRITSYIENKKEHWYPEPMIVLKDSEGLQMLRIAIWLNHRMNFQDMGERWVRRALLIEECVKIFREMDIEYRIYPLNVNVTSIPSLYGPPPNWNNAPPSEGGNKEIIHS